MGFKEKLKKEVSKILKECRANIREEVTQITEITEIILTNLDEFEEKELLRYLADIFVEINLEIFSKHLEKK